MELKRNCEASANGTCTNSERHSLSNENNSARHNNESGNIKACRIHWTRSLEADLVRCNDSVQVAVKSGRANELLRLWTEMHPELQCTASALTQRLYRIRKALAGMAECSTQVAEPSVESDGLDPPRVPPFRHQTQASVEVEAEAETCRPGARRRPGRPKSVRDDAPCQSDGNTISDEHSIPEDLRKEFFSILRKITSQGEGDLSKRAVPKCKGILVQKNLMRDVDWLIVEEYKKGEPSHWRLNCLVYAGAELVSRRVRGNFHKRTRKQPDMKRKESDVRNLRKDIGRLEAEIRRRRAGEPATSRQWANMRRLHLERSPIGELVSVLEDKKARLRVRVTQMHRLRASARSRSSNAAYRRDGPKSLCSGSGTDTTIKPPSASEVSEYWSSVIGVGASWDPEDPAVSSWCEAASEATIPAIEADSVDLSLWGSVVKKLRSWKAPGRDGICGFWWKNFHQASELLRQILWAVLEEDSDNIPTWFVKGRTVLIPKPGCQGRPEQYRPITCLNTAYKLLTAVMTEILYDHSTEWDILPPEQRAVRRGRRGCLDALMVDSMVAQAAVKRNRDLSVAWIDYQKAYDRVPHEWLELMLAAMRAPQTIQRTLGNLRKKWSSEFTVGRGKDAVKVELTYLRGLFQGDSLSPLLYVLSIAPISKALRESTWGFQVMQGPRASSRSVTHLYFMDDLKVYASGADALATTLETVDRVSRAVGMELGLRKCAVAHVKGGKLVDKEDFLLPEERTIEQVARGGTYKYLGIEQLFKPDHKTVRARLYKTYAKRLRQIWSSSLNSKNKVHATNTWAVSLFRYFFTQVKWSDKALDDLDVLTRRIMRRNRGHHYAAAKERLYLRRIGGGRGLVSIHQAFEREVVAAQIYLVNTAEQDELLQLVVNHQLWMSEKRHHNNLQVASEVLDKYGLEQPSLIERVRNGWVPAERISLSELAAAQAVHLVEALSAKPIHGVYHKQIKATEEVDQEATFAWLSDGRFRAETEGLIFAAQDGVLLTNRYKLTVLNMGTTSTCRVCREGNETIGHILSKCRAHLWSLYKERHDRVVYRLMLALCKKLTIKVPDSMKWSIDGWKGVAALEGGEAKLLVDLTIPTDRQLEERRPDLVLFLKRQRKIVVLEVAVAWEPLVVERERQKADKYQDLAADLATQHPGWRVDVVPMVAGTLGTLCGLKSNLCGLDLFTGKEATKLCKEIQFEVLCSAARMIRRHLSQ